MTNSNKKLYVLIACEESQRSCTEFRKLGFVCFSCDILDCSGGYPEWHIKGDVLPLLSGDCLFQTVDGGFHYVYKWDLIIAHPPCTYLTVTGNRWFNVEKYGEKAIERLHNREKAIEFFMNFVNCDCPYVAIENPIGCMSSVYRKPDQIIQPFWFGEHTRKSTCLWLRGLPLLEPTDIVEHDFVTLQGGGTMSKLHYDTFKLSPAERSRVRSQTFPGVAKAFAEQWGCFIKKEVI